MKNNTRMMHIACCCLVVFSMNSIASSGDGSRLAIEVPDKLTKGFPAILRVTAHGPQRIPRLSLLDELGSITITLISKTGGREYRISSSQGMELIVTTPEGFRHDAVARQMFQVALAKGKTRSMLIDLWSLRPEVGKGTILSDVPAGQYNLTVTFPTSEITSPSVEVDLIDPTEAEQALLNEVIDAGVLLKRGNGVNWSKVLRDRAPIKSKSFSNLKEETEGLIQFHLLLSNVLRREVSSRKSADRFSVPEYLRAEKESLLLELDMLEDPQKSEQAKKDFVKRHPDLKWRHQKEADSIGLLLRHQGN